MFGIVLVGDAVRDSVEPGDAENASSRRLDRISRSLIGARLWRHEDDVIGLSCQTAVSTAGRLLVMTFAKDTSSSSSSAVE